MKQLRTIEEIRQEIESLEKTASKVPIRFAFRLTKKAADLRKLLLKVEETT